MTVAVIQRDLRYPLPGRFDTEYQWFLKIAGQCQTIVFPEYFGYDVRVQRRSEFPAESLRITGWLRDFSRSNPDTVIVGGTFITGYNETYYNECQVFYRGQVLARYHKIRLFGDEQKVLTPGKDPISFRHPVTNEIWSLGICADILDPDFWRSCQGSSCVALPTASPYRQDDSEADRIGRDNVLFAKPAAAMGVKIYKSCSTGILGGPEGARLQGRSRIQLPHMPGFNAPDIMAEGAIISGPDGIKWQSLDRSRELSYENLAEFARTLVQSMPARFVLRLTGEPGAGKTTLAAAILKAAGVSGIVNSPAFSIHQRYTGAGIIADHLDFYRVREADSVSDIISEIPERHEGGHIVIIEWPIGRSWLRGYPVLDINMSLSLDHNNPLEAPRIIHINWQPYV